VPSQNPKKVVFDKFAQVAKALGSSKRLEILEHLAQGQRSVDVLAQLLGTTMANTSQHLKCLRAAGLVASRKEGKYVFFKLSGDAVIDLMSALQRTSEEHVAEVQQIVSSYFSKCDSMEALSRQQLIERIELGVVTILDVRPENEFNMAHISGAINIPIKQLSDRLSELSDVQEIIAYCRGAYCVFSFEAVALLRKKGFQARRLEDGYPEWKADGFPTVSCVDDF
jgi:rhodanese-related sulfurtransferase/DNA-binding transcriptional ArsR family regulator